MVYSVQHSGQEQMAGPIQVVLADDHAVVRAGIRHLLRKTGDIQVIGEAPDGITAIDLVYQLHPHVLLLDMEMPGMSGVDVARELCSRPVSTRVLVLSGYEDKQYILQLLSYGAAGYLTKDELPEMIVEAVRSVAHGGGAWISPRIAAKIYGHNQQIHNGPPKLNELEKRVLHLANENLNQGEIAAQLGLSSAALDRNLQTLLLKLHVPDLPAALGAARKAGYFQ